MHRIRAGEIGDSLAVVTDLPQERFAFCRHAMPMRVQLEVDTLRSKLAHLRVAHYVKYPALEEILVVDAEVASEALTQGVLVSCRKPLAGNEGSDDASVDSPRYLASEIGTVEIWHERREVRVRVATAPEQIRAEDIEHRPIVVGVIRREVDRGRKLVFLEKREGACVKVVHAVVERERHTPRRQRAGSQCLKGWGERHHVVPGVPKQTEPALE